ncbi:MAG: hypothetical protein JWQ23_4147 [Herminiimonas sp.]|nr:hypothetical protein [Herminiimonas sp.]
MLCPDMQEIYLFTIFKVQTIPSQEIVMDILLTTAFYGLKLSSQSFLSRTTRD